MTTGLFKQTRNLTELPDWLRDVDPAGAYGFFASYVTGFASVGAILGFATAHLMGLPAVASYSAIYGGLLLGLPLMIAHPRSGNHLSVDITICTAAVAIGSIAGAGTGMVSWLGQPLLLVVTFCGFYLRRFGEPWPSAGLIGLIVYIVHEIVAQKAPAAVLIYVAIPAIVLLVIGWFFAPRSAFGRGVIITANRLRAAIASLLRQPPGNPDAIATVDNLLLKMNMAREQADKFNSAESAENQALIYDAATATRVWENVSHCLAKFSTDQYITDFKTAVATACSAVADALDSPGEPNQSHARTALDRLDEFVMAPASDPSLSNTDGVLQAKEIYDLLALRQTLSHLLDAVAVLDSKISAWQEKP